MPFSAWNKWLISTVENDSSIGQKTSRLSDSDYGCGNPNSKPSSKWLMAFKSSCVSHQWNSWIGKTEAVVLNLNIQR